MLGQEAETKIIAGEQMPAPAEVAAHLNLSKGAPVTRIEAIGHIGAEPTLIHSHDLDARYPGISGQRPIMEM